MTQRPGATIRISVVIPVLNDADALERCLAALDRQIRSADELVVVDSGSTDHSADVAVAHGARVVRADVVGIPGATAAGLDAAQGDVFARLDADTVAPPDWLARIDAAFSADPALAAMSGAATFYGGPWHVRFLGRLSLTVGYFRLIAAVLGHAPLYGSNFAIRSDVWQTMRQAVHRDRPDVHDDVDLSLNLPPGSVVRYDPDLSVAVSSRSFTRPQGTRGQIGKTATAFLANSDHGLIRLRLDWFLATPADARRLGPLEQRELAVAQRLWRPLARAVPASAARGRSERVPEH